MQGRSGLDRCQTQHLGLLVHILCHIIDFALHMSPLFMVSVAGLLLVQLLRALTCIVTGFSIVVALLAWRGGVGHTILHWEVDEWFVGWTLVHILLLLLVLRDLLRRNEIPLTSWFLVPLLKFLLGSVVGACVATCGLALNSPFLLFHLPTLVLNHNGPIHQCLEVGIHNSHQL
jgi:hypothetical protein